MIHIPVPPNLSGAEASVLLDTIAWLIDALIDWQARIRLTYSHWLEPPDQDWVCDCED